jgi:Ca-activated chloride channel family protein
VTGSRLLAIFAVFTCAAQDLAPIRVDVHLVNVAFLARDASGKLITNIAKDDVEVLEDNVRQKISFFAQSSDLPLALGLVVDISGSQAKFVKQHEHDLQTFLKSVLTPRDRAFLLCFGNHLRLAADLTADAHEIGEALNKIDHKNKHMPDFPEIGPDERRILGTAFYDAIYHAIKIKLAGAEHARKALIVFSDGEDNSSAHHMLDAIEAAQSENIPIFAIRYTEVEHGRLNARNKYGMSVMERLGRETGGADFDAEKTDLKKTFREIGEQLRSLYELGYYTTNPIDDQTFHKLVIRSPRTGLTLRTKTGYYARDSQ